MKVLVAVDEPEFAKALTAFVLEHGWAPQTQFTVLSIVEPLKVGNLMAVLPGPILDEMREKNVEAATRIVHDTASALRETISEKYVDEMIIEGLPKEEIIKYATDNYVDLIVVGSHGRSGFNRLILGSVSTAVVSHAPCSVVVIRPQYLNAKKSEWKKEESAIASCKAAN